MDPSPASPVTTRVLPGAGTLTFLFTDVEGSTPLWERYEATMRDVTARHDALLDALIAQHGGTRVRERGEGDSLFAVFTRPDEAVAAALDLARTVLAEPWPEETPIRVRMGLHTGVAQLRAGDYYGPVVNRCARIRGLGHGGQVLLSAATAALVRDALPEGASPRSLGAHPLRGLSSPEEVFQLYHPDLPDEFPPLLSPGVPKHNLPRALTELIGREAEQGEVLALLGQTPLVTLTGSGGVGKTRLALAVAGELVDQSADGVWLVELAAVAEPGLVPDAVAQVLGVREEVGRPLTATLTDHLKEKHLLLVLDNCEHLVEACANLAGLLLRACPHLHILATSREGLEVAGEHRYRVPSLPVPDLSALPPPERLAGSAAVALFLARAQERRTDFGLTAQNARAVAQVCARLDGIPLAIELAAARVGSLPVEGIAARLADRFRLLTSGPRDAPSRQRTLRATLDWSYDLLREPEQALLHRLAAFAGGCTQEAAEVVCAGPGVEAWEVLDLLAGLANKSLVLLEEGEEAPGGAGRYRLLEMVRQYGWERLAASGELPAVRARHLAWGLALAEEAEPHLTEREQGLWLARLETEHDNLRAALRWGIEEGGDVAAGARLATALGRFWNNHGGFGEIRRWLAPLATSTELAPLTRARVLYWLASYARMDSDFKQAGDLYQEGLALARDLGAGPEIALALNGLALVTDDPQRAVTLHEEAMTVSRHCGYERGIALTLHNLGTMAINRGDLERARVLYQEGLALARARGDRATMGGLLMWLGDVSLRLGDFEKVSPSCTSDWAFSPAARATISAPAGSTRRAWH